jgi:hypothetical protein
MFKDEYCERYILKDPEGSSLGLFWFPIQMIYQLGYGLEDREFRIQFQTRAGGLLPTQRLDQFLDPSNLVFNRCWSKAAGTW